MKRQYNKKQLQITGRPVTVVEARGRNRAPHKVHARVSFRGCSSLPSTFMHKAHRCQSCGNPACRPVSYTRVKVRQMRASPSPVTPASRV